MKIFITGVSSGIGYGLAQHYLSSGHVVYGVSRRTPDQELTGSSDFHFQTLDLLDHAAVQLQLPALLEEVDDLDLVILNAGILGEIADMKETSLDDLKHLMDVNVWANKVVLDQLFESQFGVQQVVTISSGAAVNGNRGWSGYSISKAALNMLTQLYARENSSVHFSAVAPGLVDTAMQDRLCSMIDEAKTFPSLGVLQSKRGGPEMPGPVEVACRLARFFACLPNSVESGQFVDIRKPPFEFS